MRYFSLFGLILIFSLLFQPVFDWLVYGKISYARGSYADVHDFQLSRTNVLFEVEGKATQNEIASCQDRIFSASKLLPKSHLSVLKKIILVFDASARRGLSASTTMKIRCVDLMGEEFRAVFVHEMGHIVDLGFLKGSKKSGTSPFRDGENPIYNDDSSLNYYSVSWKDSFIFSENAEKLDFVSGYGSSDVFEDFAETYTYYFLHGPEFRYLTRYNDALFKKYTYLKEYVFSDIEYGEALYEITPRYSRPYDITKI